MNAALPFIIMIIGVVKRATLLSFCGNGCCFQSSLEENVPETFSFPTDYFLSIALSKKVCYHNF